MTQADTFLLAWTAFLVFIGCLCVTGAYQQGRYERFLFGRREAKQENEKGRV